MEQTAILRERLPDGRAKVMVLRESACSGDCHKCSGCGAAKEAVTVTAKNPIGACPGDRVVVRSESGPVLKAAAVLYVLPLALFFLGYYLGTLPGNFGAWGGLAGFLLGVAAVVLYDRKTGKKAEPTYTIISYAGEAHI